MVDIIGYEGFYKIDCDGVVYGKKGVMSTQTQNSGYTLVHLSKNGFRKAFTVHRLVAFHFCNPPENYNSMFVDHLDSNKRNNSSKNLEWVTGSENCKRSWAKGNHEKTREVARERMRIIGKKYGVKNGLFLSKLNKSEITITSISNGEVLKFNSFRNMQLATKIDRKMCKKFVNTNIPYKGYLINWERSPQQTNLNYEQ
jgi:hypothetical protein